MGKKAGVTVSSLRVSGLDFRRHEGIGDGDHSWGTTVRAHHQ